MTLSLPVELWEYIGYHALAYEENFLGSLIGLTSLLLINKRLHSALSFPSCPRLYARLFCFKFDHTAPVRRLSSRWLTAPCLAAELRKRLLVLKRLREHERLETDDLWTCYMMLLENDGRNERQLEWARLPETLLQNALFRYQTSPSNTVPWSVDYEATALIIWIGWYFTTPERLLSTPSQIRSLWSSVLLPEFILAGFKFPSVYAPDSFLHLPISTNVQTFPPTVSGPSPTLTAIVHYSLPLKLTAPVLTPAAVLSWAAIQETFQTLHPLDESTLSRFPPNRAAAIASNRRGPTVEDVLNFHQQRVVCPDRLSLPSHSTWNTYESVNSIPAKDDDRDENGECLNRSTRGSKEHDQDWYRIVSCFDIFALSRPLSGVVYPLGRLNGTWAGRYLFTDLHAHMDLLRSGARLDPKTTPIYTKPLYWNLQEHHCLKPSEGVFPGTDEYEGDDVLNAWLPRGFTVSELDDAIEISDPDNRVAVRYQTYYPDGSYRHAPSKADVSQPFTKWVSEENVDGCDRKDVSQDHRESYQEHVPSSISDSYIDIVSHRESGVADIVVTGETGAQHAEAWGDYKLVGRVRPWDGLIVLIQEPKNPEHTALGKSIFKGYIHGTNFVGRWRDTITPAGLVSHNEGSFVVSRCQ